MERGTKPQRGGEERREWHKGLLVEEEELYLDICAPLFPSS